MEETDIIEEEQEEDKQQGDTNRNIKYRYFGHQFEIFHKAIQ